MTIILLVYCLEQTSYFKYFFNYATKLSTYFFFGYSRVSVKQSQCKIILIRCVNFLQQLKKNAITTSKQRSRFLFNNMFKKMNVCTVIDDCPLNTRYLNLIYPFLRRIEVRFFLSVQRFYLKTILALNDKTKNMNFFQNPKYTLSYSWNNYKQQQQQQKKYKQNYWQSKSSEQKFPVMGEQLIARINSVKM